MLETLKARLAGIPLAAFFLLWIGGLVGLAVFIAVGTTRLSVYSWLARVGSLSSATAGLVALLCCWAVSEMGERSCSRSRRFAIAVGVTLFAIALLVVRNVLLARDLGMVVRESGNSAAPGAVIAHGGLSSIRAAHQTLSEPVTWLKAIVVGVVLSGVVSPSSEVRRLARALVAWRGARVWLCGGLALVMAAVPAVVALLGAFLGGPRTGALDDPGSPTYAAVNSCCQALLILPFIFAWYGFVSERLRGRLPDAAIALVIGVAGSTPALAVTAAVDWHLGASTSYEVTPALAVAAEVGLAIVALWLVRVGRGRLLPVALLFALDGIAAYAAGRWLSATPTQWFWSLIALGIAVALAGRMWQRSEPIEGRGDAIDVAPTIAPDYEVVVKDLGMPL